jgi:MFS family permease
MVQVGQQVAPGTALLAIVPDDQMWVEANFKETQLGSVRIGQPATVSADFYKGAVVYHGRVVGILSGTGDVFQLLPPQNATGNWMARVLQGATAGPMIPLSQSLLLPNYPENQRGLANGIWGMTAVVGPVAGPILGGWITDCSISYVLSSIRLPRPSVATFRAITRDGFPRAEALGYFV